MRDILTAGLTALGLDIAAAPQLERYAALLLEKNKVMNLTAITRERDVATLHLLDCAALLAQADMRGKTVIDVGTGAGFPGMVLAILEPSARFTLLDSLGKRVDFLREVCEQLGLKNVTCVHARAEEFAAGHRERFDIAASRAVAQLNVLSELTLPLVEVGGLCAAMKSTSTDAEIAAEACRRAGYQPTSSRSPGRTGMRTFRTGRWTVSGAPSSRTAGRTTTAGPTPICKATCGPSWTSKAPTRT